MLEFIKKGQTLIMGILNVTPDSFSDGGLYVDVKKAVDRVGVMLTEGADIIDIGGESTRPGSDSVSAEEETKRVLPVLVAVREKYGKDILISIDTYKADVAQECLRAGANMINSLGGFSIDPGLADVVAKHDCPVVIYHIKGNPKTMQSGEVVYEDVILEIKQFLKEQIEFSVQCGVRKGNVIIDPGIGFGKNVEHNLQIIKRFEEFKELGLPILVGASRKSHLGIILKEALHLEKTPEPGERIEAGLAEVGVAVLKGASIVRTHDILQTKKFLSILDKLK